MLLAPPINLVYKEYIHLGLALVTVLKRNKNKLILKFCSWDLGHTAHRINSKPFFALMRL